MTTISPRGRNLRTSFSAASLASAPLFVKNTPPPSDDATRRSASRRIGAFVNRFETCISRAACSCTAATTCGWQCPTLVTEIPHRKSRYSLPAASHRRAPSPRTKGAGVRAEGGRDGAGRGTDLRPHAPVGGKLEQQGGRGAGLDDVRGSGAPVGRA